ncbi:MAG: MoaD/ThiS family protein [Candidatus Hodarchaeales archaeon]|jgi:molybdopterin converting factor small subunit
MSENQVKILLFASIREKFGKNKLNVDIEKNMDLIEFFEILRNLHPELDSLIQKIINFESNPFIIVLNGTKVQKLNDIVITPGSELAILPPIGGG